VWDSNPLKTIRKWLKNWKEERTLGERRELGRELAPCLDWLLGVPKNIWRKPLHQSSAVDHNTAKRCME